jgi:uroporphyrin-III C-methyltransferase
VVETTLAGLPGEAAKVEPPAIICVGRTVLLRQTLDWQGGVRDLDPLGTRARSETA